MILGENSLYLQIYLTVLYTQFVSPVPSSLLNPFVPTGIVASSSLMLVSTMAKFLKKITYFSPLSLLRLTRSLFHLRTRISLTKRQYGYCFPVLLYREWRYWMRFCFRIVHAGANTSEVSNTYFSNASGVAALVCKSSRKQ